MSKTSKELNLSFNFKIKHYEFRVLDFEVNGVLRDIEYNESYFDWFMEDLVFFLEKNGFMKRWDFELMRVHNIKSLNLSEADEKNFINNFKSVTSWDMEAGNENNSF